MNNEIKALALPKPTLRSYYHDVVGAEDVAVPVKPLEVLVGPLNIASGDKIDVYWGSNQYPVATYIHLPNTLEKDGVFSLYVHTQFIKPGNHEVYYLLTPFPQGMPRKSEPLYVVVKTDIPGGHDPASDSRYHNEQLVAPVIHPTGVITHPQGVTATIAPYENMAVGDKVALYWNGIKIAAPALTEADLHQPVVIPIGKELIEEAGDSEQIVVRYDIFDVVNNWSRFSPAFHVEVETGTCTLPAPIVPQAFDKVLDLQRLASADVQARVLAYPGMVSTDEITLNLWRNCAERIALEPYIASKTVGGSVGFVAFFIPNEQFEPIAQGRARFNYGVKKASGEVQRSKSLPVVIVGDALELAPPLLPMLDENGGILDPALRHVMVQVPAYHYMARDNNVNLVCVGKTAGGANVIHEQLRQLNSNDVGRTLEFLIPDDKVWPLAGGVLDLYYTVTTANSALFKSPMLKIPVSAKGGVVLPVPRVDQTNAHGVLDPADIVLEATVRIRPYAAMAQRDKVILHWDGGAPGGVYNASTLLNSGNIGREVIFRVPKPYVAANLNDTVDIWYEVEHSTLKSVSDHLTLGIGPTVVTPLPSPSVKQARADGTIHPLRTAAGADVVIDASANFKEGDVVLVSWQGPISSDVKERTITSGQANKPLSMSFPGQLASTNLDHTVHISYSVTRANGPDQSSTTREYQVLMGRPTLQKPEVQDGVDDTPAVEEAAGPAHDNDAPVLQGRGRQQRRSRQREQRPNARHVGAAGSRSGQCRQVGCHGQCGHSDCQQGGSAG
ncbi:MAG: hypothetical protein ACOH2R_11310 [Pseudomonas sp.]